MAEVAPALRLLATSCRANGLVLVAACAFVLFTANVFTEHPKHRTGVHTCAGHKKRAFHFRFQSFKTW